MLISLTDKQQIKEFLNSFNSKVKPSNNIHIFIYVDNEFQIAYYTFYIKAEIVKEEFINYNTTLNYLKANNLITKMPKWDGSYYIGPRYDDYFVIVGHNRDSGLVEESNYSTIKEFLEKNKIDFIEVCSNHWAVGWYEQLLIHEDDIKDIEFINDNILDILEGYPIFDDEDFYRREGEKTELYKDMVRDDLINHFRNNELTYKEKKAYALKNWNFNLGKDKIEDKALEMAGEDY